MSTFIQQVEEGRTGWALFLVTVLTVLIGAAFGGAAVISGIERGTGVPYEQPVLKPGGGWASAGERILQYAMQFVPHVVGLLILWLCVQHIHGRPLRSLVTAASQIDAGRLAFAVGAWTAVTALLLGGAIAAQPDRFRFVFEASTYLPVAAGLLVLVPIQAATEELFFRGYMLQELGSRLGAWVGVVLTSVIFAALHAGSPEMQSLGAAVTLPFYAGYGLLMGAITLLDDRLELAIGIHTATNLFVFLGITYPNATLPTPALWRLDELDATILLAGFLVPAVVFTIVAGVRYGWTREAAESGDG